jgi:glyoxylase I family protein
MTFSREQCHDVQVTASRTSPMTGFSHVQLLVTDVRASEQWYATVLGLERFSGDNSVGYVALRHKPSGVVIVLSTRESPHRVDTALDHLAFAVPDGAALAQWALHLSDAGVEHDGIVLELGKPSLQLRDPDGNAIELVAPAPR